MNLASVLSSVLQRGVKPLYAMNTGLLTQPTRNTFILQRKFPIKLYKKGGRPHGLKSRNFVYELVVNTNMQKQKLVDLILMEYVAGVGNKGEKISVPPQKAYVNYILPKLAVYLNPENLEKYKEMIEKAEKDTPEYSSRWVPRTMNILSKLLLTVIVSQEHPWTVEKYHIRAAFRKIHIYVPDEAITMPSRSIEGPDLEKENKEFYITVTINNREKVKVRCRLHHYTAKPYETIYCEGFYKLKVPAIFPDDQPILDSMPMHQLYKAEEVSQNA